MRLFYGVTLLGAFGCGTKASGGDSADAQDTVPESDTDTDADTDTDTDTDADADADTDTDTDTGAPPGMNVNYTWSEDGLLVEIEDPVDSAFQLGLLDTLNPDGWRGEDCLDGMAGIQVCHTLEATGGTLTTVWDVTLVVPNTTTRHTLAEHTSDALTYALLDSAGNCLGTWGHLPDLYVSSSLACTDISPE